MPSQIIVPLDGSANAEAILPHALFIALQSPSILTLLRVIIPPGDPLDAVPYVHEDWYDKEVSWTKHYLTSLATRLQAQGADVHTQYLDGTSADSAISSYAEQHPDVQLIALATHGLSAAGRLLLGSVAKEVFASAPNWTSLLLLHPPRNAQTSSGPITSASYQTIVVPLESIVGRERVLEQAGTLALACQASILLVGEPPPPSPLLEQEVRAREEMIETGFLTKQAEQLRSSTGLTVQTAFTEGDPATFIERLYDQGRQNLLIVATRQQEKQRVMSFLHQSNVPVLFAAV